MIVSSGRLVYLLVLGYGRLVFHLLQFTLVFHLLQFTEERGLMLGLFQVVVHFHLY